VEVGEERSVATAAGGWRWCCCCCATHSPCARSSWLESAAAAPVRVDTRTQRRPARQVEVSTVVPGWRRANPCDCSAADQGATHTAHLGAQLHCCLGCCCSLQSRDCARSEQFLQQRWFCRSDVRWRPRVARERPRCARCCSMWPVVSTVLSGWMVGLLLVHHGDWCRAAQRASMRWTGAPSAVAGALSRQREQRAFQGLRAVLGVAMWNARFGNWLCNAMIGFKQALCGLSEGDGA
jgi:hypothetical protein